MDFILSPKLNGLYAVPFASFESNIVPLLDFRRNVVKSQIHGFPDPESRGGKRFQNETGPRFYSEISQHSGLVHFNYYLQYCVCSSTWRVGEYNGTDRKTCRCCTERGVSLTDPESRGGKRFQNGTGPRIYSEISQHSGLVLQLLTFLRSVYPLCTAQ